MTTIYLIGSLRQPKVPQVGQILRADGFDVFDDWHAGGPNADDEWQRYENNRGCNYQQALQGTQRSMCFNLICIISIVQTFGYWYSQLVNLGT